VPVIEFEFDDDGAVDPSADIIEHGARRRILFPKRTGIPLILVAVLAAVLVVVAHRTHRTPSAKPPTPIATIATPATSAQSGPAQLALAQVVVLAESADALRNDYLSDREILCPRGPSGDWTLGVAGVLKTDLPGFMVDDAATTRGASGTLCGLVVRAHDALGATVIMTVLAPPDASDVPFEISHGNDRTTVVDVGVVTHGWSVQVGWVGQTGNEVTAAQLASAADDERLLW
jgi:hypothetical protein